MPSRLGQKPWERKTAAIGVADRRLAGLDSLAGYRPNRTIASADQQRVTAGIAFRREEL
jgi:hypothetical protein